MKFEFNITGLAICKKSFSPYNSVCNRMKLVYFKSKSCLAAPQNIFAILIFAKNTLFFTMVIIEIITNKYFAPPSMMHSTVQQCKFCSIAQLL